MTTVSAPAVDGLQKYIVQVQAQFNEAAISPAQWSEGMERFKRSQGQEAYERSFIMNSLSGALKSILIKPNSGLFGWLSSGLPSQAAFNQAQSTATEWDNFSKIWKMYIPLEARLGMEAEKTSTIQTTEGWSELKDPRKAGKEEFKAAVSERWEALKKYTAFGVPTVVIVIGVVAGLVVLGAAFFEGLKKRATRAGSGG